VRDGKFEFGCVSRTVTPRRARFRLIIGGGTCALFLGFEPLAAKRFVQVRDQRTSLDYAHFIRWMCDEQDPDADQIILVQDNLNT